MGFQGFCRDNLTQKEFRDCSLEFDQCKFWIREYPHSNSIIFPHGRGEQTEEQRLINPPKNIVNKWRGWERKREREKERNMHC